MAGGAAPPLKEDTQGAAGAGPFRATRGKSPCATLARMAIHPDLLEILACPVCKTPVEVVKDGAGLRCAQCKRVYPVKDDIPVMLPEEASVES
jgi:uncharacterized protein YbaR (Trm112 family)